MINVVFNYNDKKIIVQSNLEEKMRDICQKFATKAEINVDSKIYFWKEKILSINPNLDSTIGKQINISDTNDIQIKVLDDPDKEYIIKFHYNGEVKTITSKGNENLMDIGYNLFNLSKQKVFGLVNGFILDKNKNVDQVANKKNKELNVLLNEEQENELGKSQKLNINTSLNENDEHDNFNDNDKNEKHEINIIRSSKETYEFLIKVYIILLIQFLFIGCLTSLSLLFNFNEIIIDNLTDKAMLWISIPLMIFILIITSMVFCYEEGKRKNCLIFNIIIYVPCITISLILLSKFVDLKYMIIIIYLIISDFLAIIIFFIIFRRYKGYGFLLFSLIFNSICMLIFYHYFQYIETKKEITSISLIDLLILLYSLIFNNISKNKINESLAAAYFFDYDIFVPAFCIFVVALFLGLLAIVLGLFLGAFAIILVIFTIVYFFDSLK